MNDKVFGGLAPELEGIAVPNITPDVEDCYTDEVPQGTRSSTGKKIIKQAELVSMFKYMLSSKFANKRLVLHRYLTGILRAGELSRIVGFKVLDRSITSKICDFQHATFWKITRNVFYADLEVELTLMSPTGRQVWKGILVCLCSFDGDFSVCVERLAAKVERKDEGLVLLSPFLIPYYTNRDMDAFAENVWTDYGLRGAIRDPSLRDATELANRIGLTIEYLDVYEHHNMDSIIFFEDSELVVGEDRVEKQEDGTERIIRTGAPKTVTISANTIVVNTNRRRRDYSTFNIFHECVHYLLHYSFHRLQELASNDKRLLTILELEVDEDKKLSDPIYFMEKQANRGAYGLMMPASDTAERVLNELRNVSEYSNSGDRYEKVAMAISRQLKLPYFRVKARMIQLGFVETRGALNYDDDKKLITPFAFGQDSWRTSEVTFVVKERTTRRLYQSNEDFRALMDSGKFIYADGHVVRNDPRFVRRAGRRPLLTDEAASRVDDCCLRFVCRYVQRNVGEYYLGRMFFDAHLVEQTLFYLSDNTNQETLDEIDAKIEYKAKFPRSFVQAFDKLMEKNDETRESAAARLHISTDTLHAWLYDAEHKITLDFIVRITLMWQIPDWVSKLLLDRAMIHVSEYDRRHQALEDVRTIYWDQGIEEANKYLAGKNVALLESYEKEKTETRKRKRAAS